MQIAVFLILLLFQQACYVMSENEVARSKRDFCCQDGDLTCCCKVNDEQCVLKIVGFKPRWLLDCLILRFWKYENKYGYDCDGCGRGGRC